MSAERRATWSEGQDIELALYRISEYQRQRLFFQNARPKDRAQPKPCDISGLDLARIVLKDLSLPYLMAVKAKLNGAELNYAELTGAKLNDTELNGAELNDAELNGAELNYAELNDAELIGAKLNDAELNYAKLTGAKLNYAEMNDAELNGADLRGAKLNDAELNGANLVGANLSGADVSSTKFTLLPSILTAKFNNTKNLDKAVFYTRNGARVTGIAIGADGHLVPAVDVPAAKAGPVQNFGAVAQNAVAFKDIYPGLLAEARAKGYVLPEHARNTGLAAAAPCISAP